MRVAVSKIVVNSIGSVVFLLAASTTVQAGAKSVPPQANQAAQPASAPRVVRHQANGKVRFIGTAANQTLPVRGAKSSPQSLSLLPGGKSDAPMSALQQYAPMFGVADPAQDMVLIEQSMPTDRPSVTRYQQQYQGLPVIGGELLVNLDANGQLRAMNGEIAQDLQVDTNATLSASQAQQIALRAVAKWTGRSPQALQINGATLSVYQPALLVPGTLPTQLVWQLEVLSDTQPIEVNEWVLVNAHSGGIAVHFSQIDHARSRLTYSANGSSFVPGSLVCDESQPGCTDGADPDADFAHQYAGDTYDFYQQQHARDGIDGVGGDIVSSVHWDNGGTCPNAFWSGSQMVYCDYFPQADDVVAHELTHGVTDHTSKLFYYYQSGAINESLSDIWGEFVDLSNGRGNDSAGVRWKMGEDLPGFGALRDMKDPGLFNDPDKMSSTNYYTGTFDRGGVHTNSAINNKAAYLMTDGDTFNGETVKGLGIDKTAAIYYEVQTKLLTCAADYADLYNALYQGCQNLVGGGKNITVADCEEVRKATDAVEMNRQPEADFNPDAAYCPGSQVPDQNAPSAGLFNDDFEAGADKWNFTTVIPNKPSVWQIETGYASSGVQHLYAQNTGVITDAVATMKTPVALSANSQLFFRHAFGFEAGTLENQTVREYFDGGLLEYSVNGGVDWLDAFNLPTYGQTDNGNISSDSKLDNPNKGRTAFVDESHGYVSTRVDLSSLAGSNVLFRFRLSSDSSITGPLGWAVDDVRVYPCVDATLTANAGVDQDVYVKQVVTLDGSKSLGAVSYTWVQDLTVGTEVNLTGENTANPTFTAPDKAETLTFQLTVNDGAGSSQATVNVVVAAVPTLVANAGPDQNANSGQGIILDGSASNGADISYVWTQTGGPDVILAGANTPTPGFAAPLTAGTLTFELAVTDITGGTPTTDTVDVILTIPELEANAGSDFRIVISKSDKLSLGQLSAQASQGAITTYSWEQTEGIKVTLNNSTGATPHFTAPAKVTSLEFVVTITDSNGDSAKDKVVVSVYDPNASVRPPPTGGSGGGGALHPLLVLSGLLLVGLGRWRRRHASS